MAAKFDLTILPDGAVRVETGDLSGPHHGSADELITLINKLMGGEVKVERKGKGLQHTHHGHEHTHAHSDQHHTH